MATAVPKFGEGAKAAAKARAEEWRAVLSGDWHFSNALPYSKPIGFDDGMTDRLRDQLAVFDQMIASAVELKAQAIFVLGDLFDKPRPDPIALREVMRAIVASPLPIYVLDGNHDAQTLKGGTFVTEVFGAVGHGHVHHLKLEAPLTPVPWLELQPFPYASKGTTKERLADLSTETRAGLFRVALIHQGVIGATHQGWTCDDGLDGEETVKGFDRVYSGHFHTTQGFGPDGRGAYLGAPMQHHFGDIGDEKRGWWFIRFVKGRAPETRHVLSKAPRFHSFDVDPKCPYSRAWIDDTAAGDYVRLQVKATHAEWVALKSELEATEKTLTEAGRHPIVKHSPVYHHAARIEIEGGSSDSVAMMRNAIGSWFDGAAVVGESFDRDRLLSTGHEILNDAMRIEGKVK